MHQIRKELSDSKQGWSTKQVDRRDDNQKGWSKVSLYPCLQITS
jgi:hypothetical protein